MAIYKNNEGLCEQKIMIKDNICLLVSFFDIHHNELGSSLAHNALGRRHDSILDLNKSVLFYCILKPASHMKGSLELSIEAIRRILEHD